MRQKRLAKLASSSTTSSESKPPGPPSSESESSAALPTRSNQSETQQKHVIPLPSENNAPTNPFSQITNSSKPEVGNGPPVDKGNIETLKRRPTAVDAELPGATSAKKTYARAQETLEDWQNRVLGDIFLVTLDENKTTDAKGANLTYLPELKDELEQSGDPVKFTTDSIDSALREAAQHVPTNKSILDYLLPCWKRVMRAIRPSRRLSPDQERVLQEAKRLCMSNCIFALSMPDYFG